MRAAILSALLLFSCSSPERDQARDQESMMMQDSVEVQQSVE